MRRTTGFHTCSTTRRNFLAVAATGPWWLRYPAWAEESSATFVDQFRRAHENLLEARPMSKALEPHVRGLHVSHWQVDKEAIKIAALVRSDRDIQYLEEQMLRYLNAKNRDSRDKAVSYTLAALTVAHFPRKPVLRKGLPHNHCAIPWIRQALFPGRYRNRAAIFSANRLLSLSFFPAETIREVLHAVLPEDEGAWYRNASIEYARLLALVADDEAIERLKRAAAAAREHLPGIEGFRSGPGASSDARILFWRKLSSFVQYAVYVATLEGASRKRATQEAMRAFQLDLMLRSIDTRAIPVPSDYWCGTRSAYLPPLPLWPRWISRHLPDAVFPKEGWPGPLGVRELVRQQYTFSREFLLKLLDFDFPAPMSLDCVIIALLALYGETARNRLIDIVAKGASGPRGHGSSYYRTIGYYAINYDAWALLCSLSDAELKALYKMSDAEAIRLYGKAALLLKRTVRRKYLRWLSMYSQKTQNILVKKYERYLGTMEEL